MGNIPLVTSRTDPRSAGIVQSHATGQEFGAQIGEAMQGLGATVARVGDQLGGALRQEQDIASNQKSAQVAGQFSYDQRYNELTLGTSPDGSTLSDEIANDYPAYVEDYLKQHPELNTKEYAKTKAALLAQGGRYYERSANTATDMKIAASGSATQNVIDTQVNKIRSSADPATYKEAVALGDAAIDAGVARPDVKLAQKQKYHTQAAEAYFDQKLSTATKPEHMEGIEAELKSSFWQKELGQEHYDSLLKRLKDGAQQRDAQIVAQTATMLTDLSERAKKGDPKTMPSVDEIRAARDILIENGGTPAQIEKANETYKIVEAYRQAHGKPGAQVKGIQDAKAHGMVHGPGNPYYTPSMSPRARDQRGLLGVNPAVVAGATKAGELFGEPLRIISGHRSPAVNQQVGGAKRSQHMYGTALDIDVRGMSSDKRAALVNALRQAGFTSFGWYPAHNDHLHADMRRGGTTWGRQYASPQELAAAGGAVGAGIAVGGAQRRGVPMPGGGGLATIPHGLRPVFAASMSRYNLPEWLLPRMFFQESGGNVHTGDSPKGAQGPFQFMPGTWAIYGKGRDVHDINAAADAAGQYMSDLYEQFGSWELALAAYNYGPGNTKEWLAKGGNFNDLPKETQNYIQRITGGISTTAAGAGGMGTSIDAGTSASIAGDQAYLDFRTRAMKDNTADFYFGLENPGMPTLQDLNDEASFAQRAKDMQTYMDYDPPDSDVQVKLFTNAEAADYANVLRGNDADAKLDLMAKISVMPETMRDYAYKQLGVTDGVWTTAARRYAQDQEAARSMVRGGELAKTDIGQAIVKKQGEGQFGIDAKIMTHLGGTISGLPNSVNESLIPSIKGLLLDRNRSDPNKVWTAEEISAAAADVLGLAPADVNGSQTLLPKNIPPETVDEFIQNATIEDWTANSDDPSKGPPIYPVINPGEAPQPLDVEILREQAKLVYIGGPDDEPTYEVVLTGDSQHLITGYTDDNPPQAIPFRVVLNKTRMEQSIDDGTIPSISTEGSPLEVTDPNSDLAQIPGIGIDVPSNSPLGQSTEPADPYPRGEVTTLRPNLDKIMASFDRDVAKQLTTIEAELRKSLAEANIEGKAADAIVKEQLEMHQQNFDQQRVRFSGQ